MEIGKCDDSPIFLFIFFQKLNYYGICYIVIEIHLEILV